MATTPIPLSRASKTGPWTGRSSASISSRTICIWRTMPGALPWGWPKQGLRRPEIYFLGIRDQFCDVLCIIPQITLNRIVENLCVKLIPMEQNVTDGTLSVIHLNFTAFHGGLYNTDKKFACYHKVRFYQRIFDMKSLPGSLFVDSNMPRWWCIERVFADAKEKHAMRYTHHRGLAAVTRWVRLKYATMNLKKLANWSWDNSAACTIFAVFFPYNAEPPYFCLTKVGGL